MDKLINLELFQKIYEHLKNIFARKDELNDKADLIHTHEEIANEVAQKSQVQFITWEADD